MVPVSRWFYVKIRRSNIIGRWNEARQNNNKKNRKRQRNSNWKEMTNESRRKGSATVAGLSSIGRTGKRRNNSAQVKQSHWPYNCDWESHTLSFFLLLSRLVSVLFSISFHSSLYLFALSNNKVTLDRSLFAYHSLGPLTLHSQSPNLLSSISVIWWTLPFLWQ